MQLNIIGEGPDRAIIEDTITRPNLNNQCQLLGQASEAETFKNLSSSDIFVISSFMESLPVVLMDALAMKVPVIAPCVAGIPELIIHNQSGLLFTPSKWKDLSECLLQPSLDSELRNRLVKEGQRRVKAEFDIEKAVRPMLSKFIELNGGAGKS